MSKYLRAEKILRSDPIRALSEINCCVLQDQPRLVRFVHPDFTLHVKAQPKPLLVAPGTVSPEARSAVMDALEDALRAASNGSLGLADMLALVQPDVPMGQPPLRVMLQGRVLQGGSARSANLDRTVAHPPKLVVCAP